MIFEPPVRAKETYWTRDGVKVRIDRVIDDRAYGHGYFASIKTNEMWWNLDGTYFPKGTTIKSISDLVRQSDRIEETECVQLNL